VLPDPAHAANALQETFVTAAATLGGLKDPGQLRACLYAAARNACHREMRTAEAGFDEIADEAIYPAEQAELWRLVRATLAELEP
jgi:DNA-directed RNA polymerase specialized sigma24 family protein